MTAEAARAGSDDARALIEHAITALCSRAGVSPDSPDAGAAHAVRGVLQRDRARGDCEPWNNWFRSATGLGRRLHVTTDSVFHAPTRCLVPLPLVVRVAIDMGALAVAPREVA
jgi:hypothetical protein